MIVSTDSSSFSQLLLLGTQSSISRSVSTGVSSALADFLRRFGSVAGVALGVTDLESAVDLRFLPGPGFGAGFCGRPPIFL